MSQMISAEEKIFEVVMYRVLLENAVIRTNMEKISQNMKDIGMRSKSLTPLFLPLVTLHSSLVIEGENLFI